MNPTPNPAPCPAFDDDLKAYLDGELTLLRRFKVRRHLQKCPQCREEIQLMQSLSEEIKVEDAAPLDVDLRAKILQNAPRNAVAPPKNRRRTVKKLGLALAGVALVAIGFNASQPLPQGAAPASGEKALSASGETPLLAPPSASPSAGVAGDDESVAGSVSAAAPSNFTRSVERRGQNGARNEEVAQRRAARHSTRGASTLRANDGNLLFSDGHERLSGAGAEIYSANGAAQFVPPQRAVHREGSVTVAVDNAETASESVAGIVKNVGGFIATNSLSTGGDGRRSATLDVRAPVEQFEVLVAKIGALGTVRAKSINGEDITQRITQANARRAVLSKELSIDQTRLREKEAKAKKSDVASISQLRAEVRHSRLRAAQSRAEWEYLRKYAALSTLYVVLQDKTKPTQGAGWTSGLGPTGAQAWNTFTATAKLPLQLLIWILAYAPLWVPALMVWKKWGRKWVNA